MPKSLWLLSTALVAVTTSGAAQVTSAVPPASAATETSDAVAPAADAAAALAAATSDNAGEIVITATRRASPLSKVPIAVSAVSGQTLQNSGATDIRQLNQLSPSLYVSSTSSEAGAGGARIRGVGTVGDNPGLESSVATFIDGVYRNRAGVALTELGPLERIEVLRGPQGTLFGRNASAGLINIVTAQPQFTDDGYAEASYGNYDYYRLGGGVTGPIGSGDKIAYRLDGVYLKRDGFLKDVISGRRINNRDRYLIRGKLLFQPTSDLSVLLIGDYSHRDEECCGAPFLPASDVSSTTPGQPGGDLVFSPSSIAAYERSLVSVVPGSGPGLVEDDTYARRTAITPGRDYRSDVRDWGGSAEINYKRGGVSLTSITAYRQYKYIKGQDADFTNLDLLYRSGDGSGYTQFKTFSQELRAQGSLFGDKLDWLVGGYFADEKLALNDNLSYGADYGQYAAGLVNAKLPGFGLFGFQNLGGPAGFAAAFTNGQLVANPAFAAIPPFARPLVVNAIASQVVNAGISNTGSFDQWRQHSRNYALFTHNIVKLTDQISLTLGARYTNERKTLDANLSSDTACGAFAGNIARLRALAAAAAANPGGNGGLNPAIAGLAAALANQVFTPIAGLPCVINSVNGTFADKRKEGEWSGTAVLSYKPTDRLLTYASFSRGYKAGGFNLDRAPLFSAATLTQAPFSSLQFQPEKVDSYEVGAKFDGRRFDLNVAAFYEMYQNFQLNTFNGTSFFVTNIQGCKDDLGTTDEDLVVGNSSCAHTNSGVISKGVELEAFLYPVHDLTLMTGFTYADTRYRHDLAGTQDTFTPANGNSLQPVLFLLPGGRLSNSSAYVATGSATWTPPIGTRLKGLAYADLRYSSDLNTGSDLFPEKTQPGVVVVNARIGIGGAGNSWSLEFWAQNLFNVHYEQVAFNAPVQGGGVPTSAPGTSAAVQQFGTGSNQLFASFLAEPRTFGVTVRTKF